VIHYLIVTGSRALADSPRAEEWARPVIEQAAWELRIGGAVVTGDARGPDAWACECADQHRVPARVYSRNGTICDGGGLRIGYWARIDPPAPDAAKAEWAEWLLLRDRVMVAEVAGLLRARPRAMARCLALVAPWSSTRGTAYTARRARDAGITTDVRECPKHYAPRKEQRHG
jgi:hypothetical protein